MTNANPDRVLTIGEFVKRVYFPHIAQYKRPSTLKGYRDIWENHVKARALASGSRTFAHSTFRAGWIHIAVPRTLGRNTLKHIKTFVSAVFKLAKQQGYYEGRTPSATLQRLQKPQSLKKRTPTT